MSLYEEPRLRSKEFSRWKRDFVKALKAELNRRLRKALNKELRLKVIQRWERAYRECQNRQHL
jgi:hypothetical protein